MEDLIEDFRARTDQDVSSFIRSYSIFVYSHAHINARSRPLTQTKIANCYSSSSPNHSLYSPADLTHHRLKPSSYPTRIPKVKERLPRRKLCHSRRARKLVNRRKGLQKKRHRRNKSTLTV